MVASRSLVEALGARFTSRGAGFWGLSLTLDSWGFLPARAAVCNEEECGCHGGLLTASQQFFKEDSDVSGKEEKQEEAHHL